MEDRPEHRNNESRAPLVDLRRLGTTKRWSVVHVTREQTVAEHSYMVAMLALRLAEALKLPPETKLKVLTYAMLHDADEAWTGDIASPAKCYMTEEFPSYEWMGAWSHHLQAGERTRGLVKVADLATDVVFLRHFSGGRHALIVLDQLRESLHICIRNLQYSEPELPWDDFNVVIDDYMGGEETYIDDYI